MPEEVKEEKKEAKEEVVKETKSTPPPAVDPNMISLTKEQYSAILDRMDELEQLALSKVEEKGSKGSRRETVDDLAEEARVGRRGREQEVINLDEMTNTELVQYLSHNLDAQVIQPLSMQIQTLKVMNEIDKAAGKHDDFFDYHDRIKEIAIENPTLSIEKAYKMAKLEAKEEEEEASEEAESKGKGKEKPLTKQGKGVKLLLPPRPTLGERPGTAAAATRQGPAKTTRQAAERAWDEVMGSGRES